MEHLSLSEAQPVEELLHVRLLAVDERENGSYPMIFRRIGKLLNQ
jgi:hypothetical protein